MVGKATLVTGRDRLLKRAMLLKQAWVVLWAWAGRLPNSSEDVQIPDYGRWSRRVLQEQVDELEEDVKPFLPFVLGGKRTRAQEERFLLFASRNYERLKHAKGAFRLCTVQEFLRDIGPLRAVTLLDAPPYAEIMMQGFKGVAYRHPEFMLARDVECLFELFWQMEDIIRSTMREPIQPEWMWNGTQNVQSLARATILACFGLLESFVSGLARGHIMTHPRLDPSITKRLERNHGSLLDRLLEVSELIKGTPSPFSATEPPFDRLFGDIKQRRDAFVHCEPGDHEARPGLVKQKSFNDVSPEIVEAAVRLTADTIRTVWCWVHDVDTAPAWLHFTGARTRDGLGVHVVPGTRSNGPD